MDYEPDPYSVATKIAIDALSRRARSRGELEEILRKKLVPEDVIERLLNRLVAQKLVDDLAKSLSMRRAAELITGPLN